MPNDKELGRFQGNTEASIKGLAKSVDMLRSDVKDMSKELTCARSEVRYIKGQASVLGLVGGAIMSLLTGWFKP